MTMRAVPLCAARQASRRSAAAQRRMHDHDAGAEAAPESIDELRRQRDFRHQHQRLAAVPRCAAAITRRYTSVLPLPVTPYSRCTANLPSVAVIARRLAICASVSGYLAGRTARHWRTLGAGRRSSRRPSRAPPGLLKCPGLNGSTSSATVAPSLRRQATRAAPAAAVRAWLGSANCRRPAAVRRPTPMAFARRLAAAQADRQRRRQDFPDGVVIVLGRPTQQVEGNRVEDRLVVQKLERASCSLAASTGEFGERCPPECRSAVGGRTALCTRTPGASGAGVRMSLSSAGGR